MMLTQLLLLALLSSTSFTSAFSTSAELNAEGIRLAQKGELRSALNMFEKASTLRPNSPESLNNLGVTLMRMGRFEEALGKFETALEADPHNRDAIDNRIELMKFIKDQKKDNTASATNNAESTRKLKPRMKLPRIPYEKLYTPGFEDFAFGRKPFVLTGAMHDWTMASKDDGTWSLDFFRSEFGDYNADFYPHNMRKTNVHPYMVPLREALDEFEKPTNRFPTDPNAPGTYIQWNVPSEPWKKLRKHMNHMPHQFFEDEKWISYCLPTKELEDSFTLRVHWRMVLIGTDNAGMFFHRDILRGSSWQGQVQGAKRWTLCDPIANEGRLYAAGEVDTFQPDLERFPKFADSICYDDIIETGDMVFYPRDYWHQTRNIGTPTITVSGTMVDENNRDSVEDELQQECTKGKWNWNFQPGLCESLQNCFQWWRTNYDGERKPSLEKKCPSDLESLMKMTNPSQMNKKEL